MLRLQGVVNTVPRTDYISAQMQANAYLCECVRVSVRVRVRVHIRAYPAIWKGHSRQLLSYGLSGTSWHVLRVAEAPSGRMVSVTELVWVPLSGGWRMPPSPPTESTFGSAVAVVASPRCKRRNDSRAQAVANTSIVRGCALH